MHQNKTMVQGLPTQHKPPLLLVWEVPIEQIVPLPDDLILPQLSEYTECFSNYITDLKLRMMYYSVMTQAYSEFSQQESNLRPPDY